MNMNDWSVNVTVQFTGSNVDFDAAIEDYLEALLNTPDVLGPVTSVNLHDQSVSALFTIEAEDYVAAMHLATRIVPESVERAFGSVSNASVSSTGVAIDPYVASMHNQMFAQV